MIINYKNFLYLKFSLLLHFGQLPTLTHQCYEIVGFNFFVVVVNKLVTFEKFR